MEQEKRQKSQREKIMEYISIHGSISPKEAETYCKCMRLAARVHELINDGVPLVCTIVTERDQDGRPTSRHASYSMA